MSWEPNWEAEAAEMAAPLVPESASVYDDEESDALSQDGGPCCPKCELCGHALDECDCFGGDDQ